MHFNKRPLASERMVGLDIGDQCASASLLGFGINGRICLEAAGIMPINSGSSDSSIAGSIRKLWRKSRFGSYTVCACLQSTAVLFKHFSRSDLTSEELKDSLLLDAEEAMQVPADKLAMDIHLKNGAPVKGPEKTECLNEGFYVAVPRQEVDRLLHILDMACLFPAIIDISCMAAANAYLRFCAPENSICLGCFCGNHADVVILKDDECLYTRSISAHGSDGQRTSAYLAEVVIEVIEHSHIITGGDPIAGIYLSGSADESAQIGEICRTRTGIPVESWNPLAGVQLSGRLKDEWKGNDDIGMKLVRSLGLALRREG